MKILFVQTLLHGSDLLGTLPSSCCWAEDPIPHFTGQTKTNMKRAHLMAKSPNSSLILLLLSLLTVHVAESTSNHKSRFGHLRSLHFSLFQHETINKTGFIIVDGVPGAGVVSQTGTPFGTIFVFNDLMTTTPDPTSRVAGIAEGASVTSSFDGLRSVSIAKITLDVEGRKGSISILGGTHNVKPANHPVVGGTADFMFVQGYVRSSPVDLTGLTVVYKIEFFLYWPPYAT